MTAAERDALLSALSAALTVAPAARSVELPLMFAMLTLRDAPDQALPELRALHDCIVGIPALSIFDGAEQRGLGPSMPVSFLFLVEWLIARAQQVGAPQSLADLERYLVSDELELTEVLAIDGIAIEGPATLGEYTLQPWRAVPISETKYRMRLRDFFGALSPTAALVRGWTVPRRHVPPWEQAPLLATNTVAALHDVVRCVAVVSGAGVRLMQHWFEPPEWAPWCVTPMRFGADGRGSSMPAAVTDDVLVRLRATVAGFQGMEEHQRERFRVPMDRLNLSRITGARSVDAAIELGIALEALFAPSKLSARVSQTIRMRASRFLGGTAEKQRETVDLAQDVYDLRSRAVHAGRFDSGNSKGKWKDPSAVLSRIQQGQDLVGKSLVKAIVEGEPDWAKLDIS